MEQKFRAHLPWLLLVASLIIAPTGCGSVIQYHVKVAGGDQAAKAVPDTGKLADDIRQWIDNGFSLVIPFDHLACLYVPNQDGSPFDQFASGLKTSRVLADHFRKFSNSVRSYGAGGNVNLSDMTAEKLCRPYNKFSNQDHREKYSEWIRVRAKGHGPDFNSSLAEILSVTESSQLDPAQSGLPGDTLAWIASTPNVILSGQFLGYPVNFKSAPFQEKSESSSNPNHAPVFVATILKEPLGFSSKTPYGQLAKSLNEVFDKFACQLGSYDNLEYETGMESKLDYLTRVASWKVGHTNVVLAGFASDRDGVFAQMLITRYDAKKSPSDILWSAICLGGKTLDLVRPYPSMSLTCFGSEERDVSMESPREQSCAGD